MADDNDVQIRFNADTDAAEEGIATIHKALNGLKQSMSDVSGAAAGLRDAFATALQPSTLTEASKAFDDLGNQTTRAAGQLREMGNEIKVLRQGLAERKVVLQAEAQQFAITQDQKFRMLEDETQKEYEAELGLLEKKLQLGDLEGKAKQQVLDKIAALQAKHDMDMVRLDAQAVAEQANEWNKGLSMITSSFNSQLRGLLAGTTSWSQAWKKMLGDMVIKFIESGEQMLQRWIAMELAKTTASTTGALTRQAAEESASSAGMVGVVANALKAILSDAAQVFGGVFAFLAPTMGPAAVGPAAAAQATVVAEAPSLDIGTDYIVRGGLALVHAGEAVVPAARANGPFTGAGMGGGATHISPSINITAMDSRSVARFFNDNAHHVVHALQRGLKGGSHLPLRSAMR